MDTKGILLKYWGHSSFRPMQEDIINSVLERKDTLALLPTGGGKSVCFQVPALKLEGLCIVVTPLIALMKDQVDNLRKKGIKAVAIYSGMSKMEIEVAINNCIYSSVKFLYLSPERLETDIIRLNVERMNVSILAVDEAHCISQWGYDFRPAYLEISDIRHIHPKVGILALTATATPDVVIDIQDRLLFLRKNVLHRSFFRENLHYIVVKESNKRARVLRGLKALSGSTIIYVKSRRSTREISQWLNNSGIKSAPYHAGLASDVKDQSQQKWLEGEIRVMVATNAFGMGIDKSNVRLVIHLDLPDSIEAYFQEAGRAGRDGLRAHAVLLYNDADIRQLKERISWSFPPIDTIKSIYNDIGAYCKLAYGSGLNDSFDFDITDFSKRYDFKIFDVYSSLGFLERESYLFVNESLHQPSKVKFKVNQSDLYYFEVANKKLEPMIKTLLRSYSGLFDDYRIINEYLLAKRLRLPVNIVMDQLNFLDKSDLIDYLPTKNGPQITWLTERLPMSHVRISYEQYGLQKQRQESRAEKLIEYLNNDICRSKQLLAYFGEDKEEECKKCDVCLKKSMKNSETKTMEQTMVRIIKEGPSTLQHILSTVPKLKEDWALELLRYLADEGLISKDNEDKWRWIGE